MSRERVDCIHRDQMFFGDFELIDDGAGHVVRVHYRGEALEARHRTALPEVTAHHLLKELVVLDIVRMKARARHHPQGSS